MLERYQNEVEILNAKIAEKEKLTNYRKFAVAKERGYNQNALRLLYDMRNDLLYTIRKLIKQIESMERKET